MWCWCLAPLLWGSGRMEPREDTTGPHSLCTLGSEHTGVSGEFYTSTNSANHGGRFQRSQPPSVSSSVCRVLGQGPALSCHEGSRGRTQEGPKTESAGLPGLFREGGIHTLPTSLVDMGSSVFLNCYEWGKMGENCLEAQT